MPVSFDALIIGNEYEHPYLADLWGYKGYQAISRGVITPSGTNNIILFVTKEKQQALTQYNDYIDEDYLHWEGEEKHSSDKRTIQVNLVVMRYIFCTEAFTTPLLSTMEKYLSPNIQNIFQNQASSFSHFVPRHQLQI